MELEGFRAPCPVSVIDSEYLAKPFKPNVMRPFEQLRLFEGHYGWLRPQMLDGYADCVRELLSENPSIPERRIGIIAKEVERRAETLARFAE